MSVQHLLFECNEIQSYREEQWDLLTLPVGFKHCLNNMSIDERTAYIFYAFNIPYEKDWAWIYDNVANFIFHVTNYYDNLSSCH